MKKLLSLLILTTMIGSAFALGGAGGGATGGSSAGSSSVGGGSGALNPGPTGSPRDPGAVNSNVNAAPGTFNRQQLDQQMNIHNDRINQQNQNFNRFNDVPDTDTE